MSMNRATSTATATTIKKRARFTTVSSTCSVSQKPILKEVNIDDPDLSKPVFECCLCHKRFKGRGSLRTHITTGHLPAKQRDENELICEFCNKKFTNKGNVVRHYKTHHSKPKIPCNICGILITDRRDIFETHIKTHEQKTRRHKTIGLKNTSEKFDKIYNTYNKDQIPENRVLSATLSKIIKDNPKNICHSFGMEQFVHNNQYIIICSWTLCSVNYERFIVHRT